MKGVTTGQIIALVAAILVVGVLIYIFWMKGAIPFFSTYSEGECMTYFAKICADPSAINDDMTEKCKGYGQKYGTEWLTCYSSLSIGDISGCEAFCSLIMGTPTT